MALLATPDLRPMRFGFQILKSVGRIGAMFIYSLAFLFLMMWNGVLAYLMVSKGNMIDFGIFYYTAQAFLNGQDMYTPSPATLAPVNPLFWMHFGNLNPPHFHFLLLPLAWLPPAWALSLWTVMNLGAFTVSLFLIVKELKVRLTLWAGALLILAFLGFSGTGFLILTGQMTFLLLPWLTVAWIKARHGHWTQAGIYLGIAMSLKLFLLLFLAYFLIRGQVRSAAVACGVTTLCYLTGIMVFGLKSYQSWLSTLQAVDWSALATNASFLGFLSRTFSESPQFAPVLVLSSVEPIWLLGIGFIALITLWAVKHDQSLIAVDRSFALILVSALLISPLGWIYYLFLPLGPCAALIVSWRQSILCFQSGHRSPWKWAQLIAIGGSLPGLFLPYQLSDLWQPNPMATLWLANCYFWTLLSLWIVLLAGWKNAQLQSAVSISTPASLACVR